MANQSLPPTSVGATLLYRNLANKSTLFTPNVRELFLNTITLHYSRYLNKQNPNINTQLL
ncbi:protein of unknown function [Paenibacillus alvei]|uniref:Uncharacterized protein n=1 Tax=Paenibacillus alvei TaxID=44250 RepID=A0A383RJH8_PAEAL|nr:protein of unknown function [Paenibacillus alvei]